MAVLALRTDEHTRVRVRRVPWSIVVSCGVLALAAFAALAPGVLAGTDPLFADPLATLQAPSAEHPAGTDVQGRDVLARIVHGARYSLAIGLGATALALVAGVLLGTLSASGPRWLDQAIGRAVDVIAAFPDVLLALAIVAFTSKGVANLIVALGVAGIPRFTRLVRAQVSVAASAGYVDQARTFGLSRARNMVRHILPNALGALPVVATIGLGNAIIGSAALSFLGLGPQPPSPEWGLMLAESRSYLRHAWWTGIFPGLALTAVVIAATVLGGALQRRYERRV